MNPRLLLALAKRKLGSGSWPTGPASPRRTFSVLKNGRARAVRFSTLAALCAELDRQPGDLLRREPDVD